MTQQEEVQFPSVTVAKLGFPDYPDISVDDRQAIINPDTGEIFSITSPKYKLVTHQDVLANVEEVIDTESSLGNYSKGVWLDEGRMRTTYRFKEVDIAIGKGDVVNPTLEVFNSYDLSWRHTVYLGAFRVICTNGMVVGEKFMTFRKRHMPDLYLEDVQEALRNGLDRLTMQSTAWKEWQGIPATNEFVDETIGKLELNKKETGTLIEEPETSTNLSIEIWRMFQEMGENYQDKVEQMTKWIFFNILTQFITHHVRSQMRRVHLESAVRRRFY